jgi:hypothetical protein
MLDKPNRNAVGHRKLHRNVERGLLRSEGRANLLGDGARSQHRCEFDEELRGGGDMGSADINNAAAQAKAAVAKLKAANQMITLAGSLLSLAASAATGDLSGIAKSASAVISEVKALG